MRTTVEEYALALVAAAQGSSREETATRVEAFVAVLRRRGELGRLSAVATAAERLLAEEGKTVVSVTTASPLSAAEKDRLLERLGIDRSAARLTERVDAAAGPGARIRVGDVTADATVAGRIAALRAALLG